MSLESPDDLPDKFFHGYDIPDFTSREGHDPLPSSGFLPTEPTGTERPPVVAERDNGTRADVAAQPSLHWSHIHYAHDERLYMGSGLFEGRFARRAARMAQKELDGDTQRVDSFLAHTPIQNERFREELDTAQQILVRTFGDQIAGDRLFVVGEEELRNFSSEGSPTVTRDGRVLVSAGESTETLGSYPMLQAALTGGVLAAAASKRTLVTMGGGELLLLGRPLHDPVVPSCGNLVDVRPEGGVLKEYGALLAWGYANSFGKEAASLIASPSLAMREGNDNDIIASTAPDKPPTGFSCGIYDTPYVDLQTGRLMLPLEYMLGIADKADITGNPADRGQPYVQYDSFSKAALGFDLLCNRTPGLRHAMQALVTDIGAKEQVIDEINSIRPGLYDKLTGMPCTPRGAHYFAVYILETLGLTDAPVGTGLDY